MKTGNCEAVNASGFPVALELNKTQSPVSKLTERHVVFCLHMDKHSTRCNVPGTNSIVSSGAVNTKPVTSSNDCCEVLQSRKEQKCEM